MAIFCEESQDNHQEWETLVVENRLENSHRLALAGKEARRKKATWIKELAQSLKKEIATWRYKKRMLPSDIEVAWILHSQIAWKGHWASAEDLFEDLEETDPARIMEAEAEGPENDSPIDEETLLMLRRVIQELEALGYEIKNQRFSENWEKIGPNSKGKGGIKKTRLKWKKKKVPGRKTFCNSSLLSDFFELRT